MLGPPQSNGRAPAFRAVASFVLALVIVGSVAACFIGPASAQTKKIEKPDKPSTPKPANIDKNGVLILVRSAIFALDHANKTGNYTVLRDLGSPAFQANTSARLGEIFANQRQQQLDFGAVAVLEPQLTLLPQIEPNGMLRIAGFFPSLPMQVDFELLFAPVDRQWRLFGISVNLSKGGLEAPVVEGGQEPAKPARAQETPDAPTAEVNAKSTQ